MQTENDKKNIRLKCEAFHYVLHISSSGINSSPVLSISFYECLADKNIYASKMYPYMFEQMIIPRI